MHYSALAILLESWGYSAREQQGAGTPCGWGDGARASSVLPGHRESRSGLATAIRDSWASHGVEAGLRPSQDIRSGVQEQEGGWPAMAVAMVTAAVHSWQGPELHCGYRDKPGGLYQDISRPFLTQLFPRSAISGHTILGLALRMWSQRPGAAEVAEHTGSPWHLIPPFSQGKWENSKL